VLSNIGATMAREVKVIITPPLEPGVFHDRDEQSHPLRKFEARLSAGIPTLPPGKTIRMLFDLFAHRPPEKGYADLYRVKASYTADATGKHYDEDVELDFGVYRALIRVTKNGSHEIHKQLEKIAGEMARWSSSGSGLLTTTHDEQRRRFAALMARNNAMQHTRFLCARTTASRRESSNSVRPRRSASSTTASQERPGEAFFSARPRDPSARR